MEMILVSIYSEAPSANGGESSAISVAILYLLTPSAAVNPRPCRDKWR
jgi:hypothetical protein